METDAPSRDRLFLLPPPCYPWRQRYGSAPACCGLQACVRARVNTNQEARMGGGRRCCEEVYSGSSVPFAFK